MKIIVLQDRLRSGGTERHSILLSREFAAAGHEAELVTFRPGGALAATAATPHRSLQPFDTGIDWLAPGLCGRVLGGSPDIVLCMGKTANCYAGRIQRRAASLGLRTRVVATLRAGDRLPWLYTRSVRRASHAVANGAEAAGRLIAAHGMGRDAVSVIHNSLVFPEAAGGRDEALRAGLGAAPGSAVLLSVAMFRPAKNQRALLEVAAGLPAGWDWRLWLVGDGPERAGCEALSRRLGLGGRVSFLGFRADPGPYYRSADIAVHASREEALSNFLIEAQAHGLPAVACRAVGVRECFVEGSTGWMVEHGDNSGFRSALALLAADTPAVRSARSEAARAFARRSFDPGRQVTAYLSLFDSLLSGKPQARP
jgi:glycosyltransferase involved in cell wall biosynthesis